MPATGLADRSNKHSVKTKGQQPANQIGEVTHCLEHLLVIKFCSICYSKPSVARPVAAQTELTASCAHHIMHYASLAQEFRLLLLYEHSQSDITAKGKLAERREERREAGREKGKGEDLEKRNEGEQLV